MERWLGRDLQRTFGAAVWLIAVLAFGVPVGSASGDTTCSCPVVICDDDSSASCAAECETGTTALCVCRASCVPGGDGSNHLDLDTKNRCECIAADGN